MKQLVAIVALLIGMAALLGNQYTPTEQKADELFTIYLIRHAEKDLSTNSGGNPPLTQCGTERAEALSTFLQDVTLSAVYSTEYSRTMATAQPTAAAKSLTIETYNGNNLEDISNVLLKRKQDALVVGHSNTTAALAGLLTNQELPDIDLDTYNRVYQVVVHKKSSRLHLFHTAFSCNN